MKIVNYKIFNFLPLLVLYGLVCKKLLYSYPPKLSTQPKATITYFQGKNGTKKKLNFKDFSVPKNFPTPIYQFGNNPLEKNKIELGRVLFYDPILSSDSTTSCASCHSPYNSFAHTDHDLSHGINNQIGVRNAPALINLAWQRVFMHDGAINNLEVQPLSPIENPKELGNKISDVIRKLQATKPYPELFYKAFNDTLITTERFLKALAQFQLTLVSANSKYDRVKLGKENFSSTENKGYKIFIKFCANCHSEPLFTNGKFENNGLLVDTTLKDIGRMRVSGQSSDSLKFKIPTLRNISYTPPYMHDGRFQKIIQVINHYSNGVTQSSTTAKLLSKPFNFTSFQKTELTAFLLTLNDSSFVFDKKHQFPKLLN